MGIEFKSFRTRVAKRVFTLFVICALFPVSTLALISFIHVRKQLYDQSQERLREENKAVAVSIYERLLFMRSELNATATLLKSGNGDYKAFNQKVFKELGESQFKSLTVVPEPRDQSVAGPLKILSKLNPAQKDYLQSGNPLILIGSTEKNLVTMFMIRLIRSGKNRSGLIVGEIESDYLWEASERLSHGIEICVLNASDDLIYSSISPKSELLRRLKQEGADTHTGIFEWNDENQSYLASYTSIFLKSNFFYPKITVVLSQSEDFIFEPVGSFKYTFTFVIVLTLALVFLLSLILIQKNLLPIESLREATRKIADGVFDHRVEIKSNDEFETLGDAFNDMNEKIKEGQALLARTSKMATMGQMAAGLMHEMNQPLCGIYGHIQLMQLEENMAEKHQKRLLTMLEAVDRMTSMMNQFRSISHTSQVRMGPVSLKESVNRIRNLFEHEIRKHNIHCSLEFQEGVPAIHGDANAIQQVISNLLINAIHAVEGKDENHRNIRIKTHHQDGNVILDIEDTGCGMSEDVREHLFEPFFSTKGIEKGSGLGMVIVETILHKHRATISVDSEVGIGTRFSIVFPNEQ